MEALIMTENERERISSFVNNIMVETFSKIIIANINTGEYEIYKSNGLLDYDGLNDSPDIYSYMQKLITDNIIYSDYATACRRFTNPEYVRKSIFSGEKRIVQSYRRRTNNGDRWITFGIIAGPDTTPENPIVLFTWREAESDAITLLDTLPTISSLYDKLIRINLSNNTYEPVIVDADEQESLVGGVINMYEWWAEYSKNGNIIAEDMSAFSALTKSGSLQKRFAEDPTPVNFRYRRKVGDEFRWMQLQIAPSVEYSEENQIMLLSLKDIHEEYTAEINSRQELINNMHRDALTNLSNRLKFNVDVEEYSQNNSELFTCLYMDVNGLHELNNILGHQKGDDMLCCVAETLKKHFSGENVYRIGGDEFVVTSIELSKEDVEKIVQNVRHDLSQYNYEIAVGIASGSYEKDIEKIVNLAEAEMRSDKAAYYVRNGDRRRRNLMNEELEQMLVDKRDSERFLDLITSQFSGVYFVDLDNDTSRPIYNLQFFPEFLKQSNNSFNKAIRRYIQRYVKADDYDRFDVVIDYHKLNEKLQKDKYVEVAFKDINDFDIILRILVVDRREDAMPETIWMIWKKYDII